MKFLCKSLGGHNFSGGTKNCIKWASVQILEAIKNLLNVSTIKSIIFRDEIIKKFGKEKIKSIDTYKWNKKKINLFINCIKLMMKCEHVVILPAQNGVKSFYSIIRVSKKNF